MAIAVSVALELALEQAPRATRIKPAHRLHRLRDLVRRCLAELLDDQPVGEKERPVGDGGRLRVVGHHDERLAEGVDRLAQEVEDLLARRRVEVAGRLVGEDDHRLQDERAGDGHALLLASGELRRPVLAPVGRFDLLDDRVVPVLVHLGAAELEREEDVLLRREHREQVEELEDEADVAPAELRQLRIAELGDVRPVDGDLALGGLVQAGEDVHERGLAGLGGAHDARELLALDVEVDAAQGADRGVPFPVDADEVARRDDGAVAGAALCLLLRVAGHGRHSRDLLSGTRERPSSQAPPARTMR